MDLKEVLNLLKFKLYFMVQLRRLLALVLLTICIGILCSCRQHRVAKKVNDYSINYYTDTINDHIVLTTVVDNGHSLSVSTLELK